MSRWDAVLRGIVNDYRGRFDAVDLRLSWAERKSSKQLLIYCQAAVLIVTLRLE